MGRVGVRAGTFSAMSSKSDENIDLLDAFHSQVTICMLTPRVGPLNTPPAPPFFFFGPPPPCPLPARAFQTSGAPSRTRQPAALSDLTFTRWKTAPTDAHLPVCTLEVHKAWERGKNKTHRAVHQRIKVVLSFSKSNQTVKSHCSQIKI